jgi:histone H3/H4
MSTSKKQYDSFKLFIYKLLKQEYTGGIQKSTVTAIDSFIKNFVKDLSNEIDRLLNHSRKTTIKQQQIDSAASFFLDKEVLDQAKAYAADAVRKYTSQSEEASKSRRYKSSKAGLELSVSRIRKMVRTHSKINDLRFGDLPSIYLTGMVEYIVKILLQSTSEVTRKASRKQLAVNDLKEVLSTDHSFQKITQRDILL